MNVEAVGTQPSVQEVEPSRFHTDVGRRVQSDGVKEDPGTRRSEASRGPVSEEELRAAVEGLNQGTQLANKKLQFQIHKKTHRMMVRVVDSETDEVIKEIPPEKALEAAAKIKEFIGMLLDERV